MFKNNRNLFIVAIIALVNALGYGIIIPILYAYSQKYGLSDFQNGLLFSIFSLCQFLSTPIIGRLSDKYGRRPLLIISLGGTALSFFMMAFAPNALFLFIARALDGITAGNLPVLSAVISDTTEEKDRAKGFGIIGASWGFGFVFGPAISALTIGVSEATPFIIAGLVSVLAVVLTIFSLRETNKHMGDITQKSLFNLNKLILAIFDKSVGTTFLITLFYSFAFSSLIFAFQPFSLKILNLSAQEISVIYAIYGSVGLIAQVLVLHRLTTKFGIKKVFNFMWLIVFLGFIAYYSVRSVIPFIILAIVFGFANSFINPLIQTILSQETDPKSQGSVQGLNMSYMSIGTIFGPILAGAIASFYIPYAFLMGAGFSVICFLLSFTVMRLHVKKEAAF